MSSRQRCGAAGILAFLAAACAGEPVQDTMTGPDGPELAAAAMPAGLPFYGNGLLRRAAPGSPCRDAVHRQFDFWLGPWDVFGAAGARAGTNIIENRLDGCAVMENWTGAAGFRGRSLNSYDAETGQWHQTWVAAQGGHLRMAGGIVDGRMILEGRRVSAASGAEIFDRYVWTVVAPDEVTQQGNLAVPANDVFISFTLTYRPNPDVMPAPEVETALCQAGGAAEVSRELDFWIGEWTVRAEHGPVLGRSTVTTDLSGCLFEERFTGRRGSEAIGWTYFDPTQRVWYRSYVDSEGERLEQSGGLAGGQLALTGAEGGPGASGKTLTVHTTIEAEGPDRVLQTWRVSRHAGQARRKGRTLIYERN